MDVVSASAVVTPDRVLRPGWIELSGSNVAAVHEGSPAAPGATHLDGCVLVPGFVDVHCHGGGGFSFGEDTAASAAAARAHLASGTTAILASLVSGPRDAMLREVEALSTLVDDGVLAGIHLEGPWLAPGRCGAHDPAQLRAPSPEEVEALLRSSAIRMITLAPELDGAVDAVRRIAGAGVVAAVGHTDADLETTRQAIRAGASHATHLFNAMRPIRHRDPGPVLALLEDEGVTLELIRDGHHLDPAVCAWLDASVSSARLVAVTDAMAGAGAPDGDFRLGALDVSVVGGVARVAGTDTLAGSTATMNRMFQAIAGPDPTDDTLLRAAAQTAANPARAVGLSGVGRLEAGARADIVALEEETWAVRGVLRGGRWVQPGGRQGTAG